MYCNMFFPELERLRTSCPVVNPMRTDVWRSATLDDESTIPRTVLPWGARAVYYNRCLIYFSRLNNLSRIQIRYRFVLLFLGEANVQE